jgi:hypothetical protein
VVIVLKGVSGHEGVRVIPMGTPNLLCQSVGEITSAIMSREPGGLGQKGSEFWGEMSSAIVERITGKKKSGETEEKAGNEKSDEEKDDSAQHAVKVE